MPTCISLHKKTAFLFSYLCAQFSDINNMKRAILSVTNDLYTDARVDKVAQFLTRNGYDVTLVGRCYGDSPSLEPRAYKTERMRLLFRKGSVFYAEFNIRLLFHLLFKRCDVLIANDLDTLLPNLIVSKLRRKRLVYDSHEYFCGILEVIERPKVQKIWHAIERFCFPRLDTIITVSQSIAEQYKKEYGKEVRVVRNIPLKKRFTLTDTRESLGLPTDRKIGILQGNGLHRDRGIEELIEAMPFVNGMLLLIVGSGDSIPRAKERVQALHLEDKVSFIPRVKPEKLYNYTALSDIGISLDKDASPNHHFSLPNKIFEYIHAGLPLFSSSLPERKRIIEQYDLGKIVDDLSPESLSEALNAMIQDDNSLARWKTNCQSAATELCWENEENVLSDIYLAL